MENNINTILKNLFSFRTLKRRDNINDLIEIYKSLGSPCNNIKFIHIAGTNGKGSSASFIENILLAANYNVGTFTSPHILKFNERIIFNNDMIKDKDIIIYYNQIINLATKYSLNFFEITFFISLLYFHDKNPDFIILETGLGGRLDATNVIDAHICAITNISFDHTNILGNSLKEIAFEKAGIIKNNNLCLFSQNLNELEIEITKKTNNYINLVKKYNNLSISLNKNNFKTTVTLNDTSFELPLFGKFQAYNFLIAYEISKIYNIDDTTIQKGLNNVYWPARFEFFSKNPTVILDAAHNDDSFNKLYENLSELYKKEEIIIITSLLETKDFIKVFSQLKNISNKIYVTSLKDVVYGLTSSEIKEKMVNNNISIENIIFEDNISTSYYQALNLINDKNNSFKVIVICGSFYEISNFKNSIKNKGAVSK